jgi:hypothetical protein
VLVLGLVGVCLGQYSYRQDRASSFLMQVHKTKHTAINSQTNVYFLDALATIQQGSNYQSKTIFLPPPPTPRKRYLSFSLNRNPLIFPLAHFFCLYFCPFYIKFTPLSPIFRYFLNFFFKFALFLSRFPFSCFPPRLYRPIFSLPPRGGGGIGCISNISIPA